MNLEKIIQHLQKLTGPVIHVEGTLRPQELSICGVSENSKYIQEKFLFAALPGLSTDGRDYIEEAIQKGAHIILTTDDFNADKLLNKYQNIVFIKTQNPRHVFSIFSAIFHGAQPQNIVAVTGTNGKTSTVRFTQQLWEKIGLKAASLGTLGLNAPTPVSAESQQHPTLTTPEVTQLHHQLAGIKKTGVEYIAMEASSHGLSQYRLDGLHIKAAAFTNLSHDHLDYHGSFENYFQAKRRLLSEVLSVDGTAVLNADSKYFLPLKETCEKRKIRVISFGFKGDDILIKKMTPHQDGISCTVSFFGKAHDFIFPLIGNFQLMNALTAFALVYASLDDPTKYEDKLIDSLSSLKPIRGRLEKAGSLINEAQVFVDYAHTPEALEYALTALRAHCQGKLHLVFGCGGNRDHEKRPIMGKVAEKFADKIIVTDDNPRFEDGQNIRKQILSACQKALEIADRRQAIWQGLSRLEKDDFLLIAGKGHEPGQIIGDVTYPFDDVSEAKKAIKSIADAPISYGE